MSYFIELKPPYSHLSDVVTRQFPFVVGVPAVAELKSRISQQFGVPVERLILAQTNRTKAYQYQTSHVVELTILPPSVGDALKWKLPPLIQQTIGWLLTHEELKEFERFDIESLKMVRQQPNGTAEKLVCITNVTNRNCLMKYHNQEMLLSAILPNDQGVELLGEWSYTYKAASEEQIALVISAREKRDSDIAHCQKLLKDLPVALANSITAMEKLADQLNANGDSELSEAGAIAFEQLRIRKEIAARDAELKQLDPSKESKEVFPFDKTKFIPMAREVRVVMPFGFSRFEGKLYNVFRMEETKRQIHAREIYARRPSYSLVAPLFVCSLVLLSHFLRHQQISKR